MARKAVSKRIRFEVFKRDSFSCQYCGKSAPDVVLHLDHINPVAKGGGNEILNLITACDSCNLGKSAVALDDNSTTSKQMKQLKLLNERRAQIQMIADWRTGLLDIEHHQLDVVGKAISTQCGYSLNDIGKRDIQSALKKYGLEAVLDAVESSARQYLKDDSLETACKFIDYIPKICFWNLEKKTKPEIDVFNHICNLAARKGFKCSRPDLWRIISSAHYDGGVSTDLILNAARQATGIMNFHQLLDDIIGGHCG